MFSAQSQAERTGTTAAPLVTFRERLMFPAGVTINGTRGTQLRQPVTSECVKGVSGWWDISLSWASGRCCSMGGSTTPQGDLTQDGPNTAHKKSRALNKKG